MQDDVKVRRAALGALSDFTNTISDEAAVVFAASGGLGYLINSLK